MGVSGEERDEGSAGVDQRRIRILFLAANPQSTGQRAIEQEVRKIDERLRGARYRDRFELISRWAVRPDDLMQALLDVEPDIVHFSGRGNQNDEILLENDRGRPFPVSKKAIANLFGVLKDRIRLVVLNACYSLPQARAIVEHIGCAVGMQRAFGDEAAIEFAAGLYQGLAFGRSIGKAFDIGRATIGIKGIPEDRTPQILAMKGVDPQNLFMLTRVHDEARRAAQPDANNTRAARVVGNAGRDMKVVVIDSLITGSGSTVVFNGGKERKHVS